MKKKDPDSVRVLFFAHGSPSPLQQPQRRDPQRPGQQHQLVICRHPVPGLHPADRLLPDAVAQQLQFGRQLLLGRPSLHPKRAHLGPARLQLSP